MNQENLSSLQKQLSQQVQIPSDSESYFPDPQDTLFTLDIQYTEDFAFIALDISYYSGEEIAIFLGKSKVPTEYISQFFCFREGPPLIGMIEAVAKQGYTPDLILIDGHGIAHPRKFGVACYVGIYANLPTIGCAKRPLLPYTHAPDHSRGSTIPIKIEEEKVGYSLRSQDGVKPLYVSPGHLISITYASDAVLPLASVYRLPEPIRRADQAARLHAKGEKVKNGKDLGEIIPLKI